MEDARARRGWRAGLRQLETNAMPEPFDPYYHWLGISPEDGPPDHYRLLGLRRFESDANIIRAAAEQRFVYLRTFQLSPQADLAERLLNEIAAAKVCLLDAQAKESYDAKLTDAERSSESLDPDEAEAYRAAEVLPVLPLPPSYPPVIGEGGASREMPAALDAIEAPSGGIGAPERSWRMRYLLRRRKKRSEIWIVWAVVLVLLTGAAVILATMTVKDGSSVGHGPHGAVSPPNDEDAHRRTADARTSNDTPDSMTEESLMGAPDVEEIPPATPDPKAVSAVPPTEPRKIEAGSLPGKDSAAVEGEAEVGTLEPVPISVVVPERLRETPTNLRNESTRPEGIVETPLRLRYPLIRVPGFQPMPFRPQGIEKVPDLAGGALTIRWATPPTKTKLENGVVSFTMGRAGVIYMAVDWTVDRRHSGGPWRDEQLDHDELLQAGWESLGPAPWNKKQQLYRRVFGKGATCRLRVYKYLPPQLIVPVPKL